MFQAIYWARVNAKQTSGHAASFSAKKENLPSQMSQFLNLVNLTYKSQMLVKAKHWDKIFSVMVMDELRNRQSSLGENLYEI